MASTALDIVPRPLAASRAVMVLGTSLVLGVAADVLLRGVRWGLGFPMFVVLALTGGALLWRRSLHPVTRAAAWMALPMMVFSLCLAWRDSDVLRSMNLFAFFMALGILVSRIRLGALGGISFADLLFGWVSHAASTLVDAVMLISRDIPWQAFGTASSREKLRIVLRGALIAVPILAVFGGLLAAADAVFADYLKQLTNWDGEALWLNFLGILVGTWVTGSILRRLYLAPEPVTSKEFWGTGLMESQYRPTTPPLFPPSTYQVEPAVREAPKVPTKPGIGNGEAAIALGALVLLLGAFAAIQVRFLFGGAASLPAGVTSSEYARSGFFELLAVCCLAVPVLRLVHFGVKRRGANGWTYPAMAGVVIGLLGIVVASAFRRLSLCVDAYGLSELRLYGGAAMAWIAGCLGWLLTTLLMRKHQSFVFGAVLAGLGMILGLNALNPDALIAQVNLDRALHGKGLDTAYLAGLSFDARPEITKALPGLRPAIQEELKQHLAENRIYVGDWREWNLGRAEAYFPNTHPARP